MRAEKKYTTEAALCADFIGWAEHNGGRCFSEWAGWDIVVVLSDGSQIGIQAKLRIYDREAARIACSSRSRIAGDLPPEIAIPTDAPMVIRHTVDLYGQGVRFESFVKRFEGSLRTPCGYHGPCGREDCCADCAGVTR